jgi:hypothetical protein
MLEVFPPFFVDNYAAMKAFLPFVVPCWLMVFYLKRQDVRRLFCISPGTGEVTRTNQELEMRAMKTFPLCGRLVLLTLKIDRHCGDLSFRTGMRFR